MNPKVTLKDVSPIRKDLEVVVAMQDVARHLDGVYQRIGKKAKLKGFRPGKVPRSVLEQYYRQDAESEAMRELINLSYPAAVQEAGVIPIASPQIRVTAFGPDQDLAYEAMIEIPPQFEVAGYKDLKLAKDKIDVADQEIDDNLKGFQDRLTQLTPLLEDRPARENDIVALDYRGTLNGQPVAGFEGKDFLVELGKGYLFPEIEKILLGAKVGEKKQTEVTLPDNWADKNLAGKKIDYELSVKQIKQKKVPELNDDFAKDVGNFENLAALKAKVKEDIVKAKEQAAKNKMRREVLDQLIAKNDFLVPEAMIQIEMEDMFRRFEGNLRAQNISLEQAGVTVEDFYAKNRDEAVHRVRGALIFDAIARKENISVTPDEIEKRIEDMAKLSGQQPAVWKKYFQEHNMLGRVEGALLEEKALDFVLTQSKIKVKEI
ncbi:MAG TPA: trigger factor [bacterium]|nr:trigger factor [bacterium]